MAILTDNNYVDKAEEVIKSERIIRRIEDGSLTITKLRNLLSLTSALYDEVQQKDFAGVQDRLAYLRVQFVYQSGRDKEIEIGKGKNKVKVKAVKELVEEAEILQILEEIQDKESLIRFCRYMEAIVAYFKYYGGND